MKAKENQRGVAEWCRNRMFTEKEEKIVKPFPVKLVLCCFFESSLCFVAADDHERLGPACCEGSQSWHLFA